MVLKCFSDSLSHWEGCTLDHCRSSKHTCELLSGALSPKPSHQVAASFLSGPKASSFEAYKAPKPEDLRKSPRLEPKVRIRLMFQSPEIYSTDIGQEKPNLGAIYGCRRPDKEGKGEKSPLHPEIIFNALPPIFGGIQGVHVHLEDKTSGIVYWDADYKLPLLDPLVNLAGKTRLKKFAQAENFADSFYKPCVEKDDMEPHFYDLTIRTNGKFWDEDLQEFRPNTGFERGRMPVAHIGFQVQRFPQILKGKEKMGEWRKPGDSYANPGIGEPDPALRAIYDEEDPFYDPVKGKTFRGYYGDIIEKGGRTKDTFGYLFNYGPNPLLLEPPEWKTIEAAAKKMR